LIFEAGEFFVPGEVDGFVRGEDAFKDVEMGRNALRQAAISAGSKKNPAARTALVLKESKQFGVVGQTAGIERSALRHFELEAGAAAHQPEGDASELERVSARKEAKTVQQGVGLDQSAVQIDTEGRIGAY